MKTPANREKRWVKQKGCVNVARMWREDLNTWLIVPMNPDKPFSYITPKWEPQKVVFRKFMEPIIIKSSPEQKKRHQKI